MSSKSAWITTVTAIVFGCAGGAFAYLQYSSQQSREIGRIEAENNYLKDQVAQFKIDNSSLRSKLEELAASNNLHSAEATNFKNILQQRESQLTEASVKIEQLSGQALQLAALADSSKRCAPDRAEITELQNELEGRTFSSLGKPPSEERKAQINALLVEHHQTLRTCLSATL